VIATIARKEFLEMVRDGRARAASAAVLAMLIAALLMGWKEFRDVQTEIEAAKQTVRQQWLAQSPKNPHQAAHYGTYAFKPRNPLSLADSGINRFTGVALFLEPHRQNDLRFRPAQDATVLERFGQMTASATLEILLPLVIIMITFGSFAGEKESGTLRQVLSAGVQPRSLACGKFLGVGAALALLLAPATVMGVIVISPITLASGSWDSIARAAILSAGFLLYLGGWTLLCLCVSAWASSSRLALVILLGFWIGNCLVAPRAMADIAGRFHPSGSALESHLKVTREAREGPDGHNPNDPYWRSRKQELFKQYKVSNVADLPFNFDGLVAVEAEKYSTEVYRRHFREIWSVFERQDRVYRVGGMAAPMLAIQSLSMGLASTDFQQQRHFAEAAESYRARMALDMNGYIMNHVRYGDRQALAGRDLWETLPDFDYTMPDVRWVIANQRVSVTALAAWFGACFILAVWRAERVRPV